MSFYDWKAGFGHKNNVLLIWIKYFHTNWTLNIGSINSTQEFSQHNVENNPAQTSLSFQLPPSSALHLLPPSEQLCTHPFVCVCLCFPHLVRPPNMCLGSSLTPALFLMLVSTKFGSSSPSQPFLIVIFENVLKHWEFSSYFPLRWHILHYLRSSFHLRSSYIRGCLHFKDL